jgi:hypothetical protein
MENAGWFDDVPVLGKLPAGEAAAKLREVNEPDVAKAIETAQSGDRVTFGKPRWWPFQDKPWHHTAHAFGYLPPTPPAASTVTIAHAGNISPDQSLRNSRIKITLDRLRVAAYPGGGTHRVLFDFYAQNQVPGDVEHLHFNATYRVHEGEQAAILGFPIFVGLNVGNEGVAFKCFTVNVKNDQDESFLGFLESDVFKAGLKLASTVQPAIGPFSQMALGLTKSIATRHQNVAVQDFYMGLDFSSIATRARLAEGSYIAVQIPESIQTIWDWSEWHYNPANGQIVGRDQPTRLIPYNYLVYSVSRYEP